MPEKLPRVHVFNKVDLTGEAVGHGEEDGHAVLRLSAKAGLGLDELKRTLLQMVGWGGSDAGVFLARERHLDAIRRASSHLHTAAQVWQQVELFAEELRLAQHDLSSITGEFTADDLLGEIFSRFCIGK